MTETRRPVAVDARRLSWVETAAALFSGRMLVALLMGFASGLPRVIQPPSVCTT